MENDPAAAFLVKLERRVRWLAILATTALVATAAIGAVVWSSRAEPHELRLRTLSIVDGQGMERVRIAGQLPDAIIDGKPVPRGDEAAGVLIYDDGGQERGGYVTFKRSRTAALTLDTRKGMVVLLSADSTDGAALKLWGANFTNWLDLRAGASGARMTVVRGNEIVVQQPSMSEADAETVCRELNGELAQLKVQPPLEEVLRACRQHMTEALCRRCLQTR